MINMFSSVNVNVEDGNLGRSTVEGRGVQVTGCIRKGQRLKV